MLHYRVTDEIACDKGKRVHIYICVYIWGLTYYVDGMRADHVLCEFDVGSVADDDDAAALVINAERHVRAGDPATVRRRLCLRGVTLGITPVHRPLYVRGWIRVLRRASNEYLVACLRFRRSGDGDPSGRDCGS